MNRKTHLKIKIKSLSAEAKIIREEEHKKIDLERSELREHRAGIVRHESRHAQLAYGLLRGIPYWVMEKKCKKVPDWKKIQEMAERFGADRGEAANWVVNAKLYLQSNKEVEKAEVFVKTFDSVLQSIGL